MNELTWQRVLAWEALHQEECDCPPKLIKFQGKPDKQSYVQTINQTMQTTLSQQAPGCDATCAG